MTLKDDFTQALAAQRDELIVPAPSHPMGVARLFLDTFHTTEDSHRLLAHHRNTFHSYTGTCWPEMEERALVAELYRWLEPAKYYNKKGDLVPFEPTRYKLGNLLHALAGLTHVSGAETPPLWLAPGPPWPASEMVATANGLLHVCTRTLVPHTPTFFSPNVLPFSYDPSAPVLERWARFLAELWDDIESQNTLAEMMGYLLAGGTSLQKIMMLVGPRRSGKGTIGRVLTGLLGAHNVAAPTLAGLTTNFGLSPLIGKPLALVSDARLGKRTDGTIAGERLLSISGEDSITIDRKYRDPWTGRLPTRFLFLTNELPALADASGALPSRFVLLMLTKDFYGKEDPALTEELLAGAPGIFNWCLDGLDRLMLRGHFEMPPQARDAVRQLEDLASPVGAFVRDRCEIGAALEVRKDDLFDEWKAWCDVEGSRAGTKAVFARDLRAAIPNLKVVRPREGTARDHLFRGVALKKQWARPLTIPDPQGSEGERRQGSDVATAAQNPRSTDLVRDGQGSSALYSQTTQTASARVCEVCSEEMHELLEASRTRHPNCHAQDEGVPARSKQPLCLLCRGPMRQTPAKGLYKCLDVTCGKVRVIDATVVQPYAASAVDSEREEA